jgi:hypothetical protein
MSTIALPGLTPDNPLGFRAAVGLLSLCEQILPSGCRLSWQQMQAMLHTEHACDEDALVDAFDHHHRRTGVPNWLTWDKDLRVPVEKYREQLAIADRNGQDALASLAHEANTDKNGKLFPTAWRMYGIKERTGWLDTIGEIAQAMNADKWREALFGPWRYEDQVSPLGWDPNVVQHHAEQARNASATRPIATAGAVWLAVLSLPLFPVFLGERRLATTGIVDSAFCWPVWSQPATLDTVRFLLQLDYGSLSMKQRQAIGIRQLWRSRLIAVGDRRALEAGSLIG